MDFIAKEILMCRKIARLAIINVCPFLLLAVSCRNVDDDYNEIKRAGFSGAALFEAVLRYEVSHAEHFESKLDLAQFYFLQGDYNSSFEYISRAELNVQNAPRGAEGKRMKSLMYGTRAELEMLFARYADARTYAQKAFAADRAEGLRFRFIEAAACAALGEEENALAIFDELFKTIPDAAAEEDMRIYMRLLFAKERFADCKTILEMYFETGAYISGLGAFASSVYEKCGELEKAALIAYLDWEYRSGFEKVLDTPAFDVSALDFAAISAAALESDFFVAAYLRAARRIESRTAGESDIETLLSLEKYFVHFPSYYWRVYEGFAFVRPDSQKNLTPVLEKIIALGSGGIFAADARRALGSALGFNEQESEKLLIETEVDALLLHYEKTKDATILEQVFALLELPDNAYELYALTALRERKALLNMDALLLKKKAGASPRLSERLDFILR